jgi:hypothetical protein
MPTDPPLRLVPIAECLPGDRQAVPTVIDDAPCLTARLAFTEIIRAAIGAPLCYDPDVVAYPMPGRPDLVQVYLPPFLSLTEAQVGTAATFALSLRATEARATDADAVLLRAAEQAVVEAAVAWHAGKSGDGTHTTLVATTEALRALRARLGVGT